MNYLTVSNVIAINDDLVKSYGGHLGIRDNSLLESAVFRCQVSFGGYDLYTTLFEKAAAIFHGIIFDHPFLDGNKRASFGSATAFLFENGWKVEAGRVDTVNFPLTVEKSRLSIEEIAAWFKKHSRKNT